MNQIEDPDVINGKESERQTILTIAYSISVILSWYLCQLTQYAIIRYTTRSHESASNWISSESYILWNILMIGVILFFVIDLIIGYQGENSVRVTMNIVKPGQLSDGGIRYIVYRSGLFLRSPLETKGFETDIDRERTETSEVFNATIKSYRLEMALMLMWLPYSARLSAFFQNGKTDIERREILTGIMAIARQMTETIASKMESVEIARQCQDVIAEKVKDLIRPVAADLGFWIKQVAYTKCDYTADVQASLDAGIKAEAFKALVASLVSSGVDPSYAADHAALQMKTEGVKITRNIHDIQANAHVASAVDKAGPALAALLAGFLELKNKQEKKQQPPKNTPKPKGK